MVRAGTSTPMILFTYPESVVGRRTEWYLTLRGIPYQTCQVDSKMPRPVLESLDIHYRRIPILAIGRDIYCDSRCIIDHLERLYTDSPRLGADERTAPYQRGIERILEAWAFDGGLFMRTAQMIAPDATLALSQEWLADRSELTGIKFDADTLRKTNTEARAHARVHLQMIEDNLLADGRKWIAGGEAPSVSDVHVLWIFDWMLRPKELMGMQHAYPHLLNRDNYPRVYAWVGRMEAIMQDARSKSGHPKSLSADEAVNMIETADFWEEKILFIDEADPTGLKRNDLTDLIALDSAPAAGLHRRDVGTLQGLTSTSATIATETANGVQLRIHYPRVNVRVAKAGDGPRLSASEIPG